MHEKLKCHHLRPKKKNLSPPVQLGQSISEMSQVWCVKHAAWTCVYIYMLDGMIDEVYVHTTISLIWLMMLVYFYIWWRMMWGQSVLGIIKLYNIAKLFRNPLKFYSVPYHITIFYTRICCMARWLKNFGKNMEKKKKRLPCHRVPHLVSSFPLLKRPHLFCCSLPLHPSPQLSHGKPVRNPPTLDCSLHGNSSKSG